MYEPIPLYSCIRSTFMKKKRCLCTHNFNRVGKKFKVAWNYDAFDALQKITNKNVMINPNEYLAIKNRIFGTQSAERE